MTRKCPHCGRLVDDIKAILCPSCDTILANEEGASSELTHEQIIHDRKAL
jgi:NMD protein affecting ribosome stability and mRNA decay